MEQRRRTVLRACSGHLTSTLDVVCALLIQPCWWYRPPDVQHSVTVPSQLLRFGTCVEQPAVVCQAPSLTTFRRELKSIFPVVVWQWLGDRDCTAQYNCSLPATTDCRRFCRYRATRMHRADYAVARCLSVCLSVCHTPVLSLNGHTYPIFLLSGSPTILVFLYQTGWQYYDGDPF